MATQPEETTLEFTETHVTKPPPTDQCASEDTERVLVTRASGFVASHVIKQLLEEGYRVRGTLPRHEAADKSGLLHGLAEGATHPLEIMEVDPSIQKEMTDAVHGCSHVVHVLCPHPNAAPGSRDVDVSTSIQNMLQVIRACRATPTVKRLIITSSTAAIQYGHDKNTNVFTEDNWSDMLHPDCSLPYRKAIVLSEKSAWTYMATLPNTFEVVALNPGFTLGPVLLGRAGTNLELFKTLLHGDMKMVPRVSIGIVDVRDVAKAHSIALKAPDVDRKRHILVHCSESLVNMASILAEEFNPYGYHVPTSQAPDLFLKVMGRFDKSLQVFTTSLGKEPRFDTTRMQSVLKLVTRPTKETLIDMVHSMIEIGMIKRAQSYPLQRERLTGPTMRNLIV